MRELRHISKRNGTRTHSKYLHELRRFDCGYHGAHVRLFFSAPAKERPVGGSQTFVHRQRWRSGKSLIVPPCSLPNRIFSITSGGRCDGRFLLARNGPNRCPLFCRCWWNGGHAPFGSIQADGYPTWCYANEGDES